MKANSLKTQSHATRPHAHKYKHWDLVPLIALACATIATFRPVQTTFDVSAVTDRLSCTTSKNTVPVRWAFQDAELQEGWNGTTTHVQQGSFQPNQDIEIRFQRIGQQDVIIDTHAHESNASVGTLSASGIERHLSERAVFRVHLPSDKRNTIFVIAGHVIVGNIVKPLLANPNTAILQSGTVTPIGYSLFSNSRYEADATSLEPGDEFVVDPDNSSEGYGLILLDERGSMNVTYRVYGREGQVTRFGGTGFDVDISLFSRIKHDNVIQGFWAAFIFITGLRISQSRKAGSKK